MPSYRHPEVDISHDPADVPAVHVRSIERVRDLGEVFTPAGTVQAMLDLLPGDLWDVHPSATFLEPACGDGNFLVAILERKLAAIRKAAAAHTLPAGVENDAVEFHALEALASIYAVDISIDNVIGGTPGHEAGARDRLISALKHWYSTRIHQPLSESDPLLLAARWVVVRNIQIGNMLAFNHYGRASGREQLPLIEYQWNPSRMTVRLSVTTLGEVIEASASETPDAMTLFQPPKPIQVWEGDALRVHEAPIEAPMPTVMHARNGNGRR